MKMKSCPPQASAMIESLRGMGYTIGSAIADVIDNSISAGAGIVRLDFGWSGEKSFIRISDNGHGLTAEELDQAMVLGSTNPLKSRSSDDLGRFGMGLKTASLSQCRRLTVASRASEEVNYRCWDLDVLATSIAGEWTLLLEPFASSRDLCRDALEDGFSTTILWEGLDRVVTPGFQEKDFLVLIDEVERHLAMTFHRFLEGQNPRIRLHINGSTQNERVRPWDPFMRSHDATMATPVEILHGGVAVQGYVLPHRDKLSNAEFETGSGSAGWVSRQGFYVYRGNRLLVTGSWLGLGEGRPWPKDDLHRLARISLDLPNSLDHEWRIDIKKSTARPPVHLRNRLVELAKSVRADARRVFTHRGEVRSEGTPYEVTAAWTVSTSTTGARYRIDEAHPVIARILEESGPFAGRIRQMLRVIEETVPIQRIWLDSAEAVDKEPPIAGESVPSELMELLVEEYRSLIGSRGLSPDQARHQLSKTAPFHRFPEAIALLGSSQQHNEGITP